MYFEKHDRDRDFAVECPIYIFREVEKIIKDVNFDFTLLRSNQSIDRQIKEIFDSLAIEASPTPENFEGKLYYCVGALLSLLQNGKLIDFVRSRLSIVEYLKEREDYCYGESYRDRVSIATSRLTSIPGINLKIARKSERLLASYKSDKHKEALKYVLRVAQSQMVAHRTSIYSSGGLMSKDEFLIGWFPRYRSYQENSIDCNLQPGDVIRLIEGEFILDKNLAPVKLE